MSNQLKIMLAVGAVAVGYFLWRRQAKKKITEPTSADEYVRTRRFGWMGA